MKQFTILEERKKAIAVKGQGAQAIACDTQSVSGAVSQRACVFCGARVVLNPITDAVHIIHGPIGCASYTWDIRGSLSSGPELYRNSFSTDMKERDVIFGGEKKLAAAIDEAVATYAPKAVFVLATCIVGVIGDDIAAVCRAAAKTHALPVIPVQSSGFSGNKSTGYRAACEALLTLMTDGGPESAPPSSLPPPDARPTVNFLGDFNLAGEAWLIRGYLEQLGLRVNVTLTGDSRVEEIVRAPRSQLNLVQCAGSMHYLAAAMEQRFDIPSMKVSFFGLTDTADSLRRIAAWTENPEIIRRAEALIEKESAAILPELTRLRERMAGKQAAIYVGGGFKAISLIHQFREIGMETVMVGTQTGRPEEYAMLADITAEGTVILDDANPAELERFMKERGADILVGGVKERPLAYKLGVAFCDHNHERKFPLCGFAGATIFAKEIDNTIHSPVWKQIRRERRLSHE